MTEDKYEKNRKNYVFLLKFTYLESAKKIISISKISEKMEVCSIIRRTAKHERIENLDIMLN